MMKTILVPLDGSPLAERALPHAEAIARATNARIVLVRVAHEPVLPGANTAQARMLVMRDADAYVTAVADRLRAAGLATDTGVVYGGVAAGIMAEATSREADVIVMATHGRGGLGRLVYGSVAEAVLRGSAVPLLLMRAWQDDTPHLPFSGRPRIIVPLDGSSFAEEALPVAASLGMALGGELVLLHAVSPFEQAFLLEATLPDFPQREAERAAQAREYLRTLVARSATGGCQVHLDVRLDVPTRAIEAAVRDHDAALVVMATHGRTAVGQMVLGSVANTILQHTQVPLALVRPRQLRVTTQAAGSAEAVSQARAVPVL